MTEQRQQGRRLAAAAGMEYVLEVPQAIPLGKVLVHNSVRADETTSPDGERRVSCSSVPNYLAES
jgi:hypothetical protein